MAASMEDTDSFETEDLYAFLNIERDASREDISNAYRRFSKIYHPDKHLDDASKKKAEMLFNKVKFAYEVLKDPQKRAIYDTLGLKGVETMGKEVVLHTKSAAEIYAEYERLKREEEQRRLEQRTNPRGDIVIGVDCTDLFNPYLPDEDRTIFEGIHLNEMTVQQSVECPLTTEDTVTIAGHVEARTNGTGQGHLAASYRRIFSPKSWGMAELVFGSNTSLTLQGFRTFTQRCYGTISTNCLMRNGRMGFGVQSTLCWTLDQGVQARLIWNAGLRSSISSSLSWERNRYFTRTTAQLGVASSFLSFHCTRKFDQANTRVKATVKVGTLGASCECGVEAKVTQFSRLGASLIVGVPNGVTLKLRVFRGNQTFLFPIRISEGIEPEAIFYGVVIPLGAFFAVRQLIVRPFLARQKKRSAKEQQGRNAEHLARLRQEAVAAQELMKASVERIREQEEEKGGLVIVKAFYGQLTADGSEVNVDRDKYAVVTVPLQHMVKDSAVIIPDSLDKNNLPGFYDPCYGEEKHLFVQYNFRHAPHAVTVAQNEALRIPQADHAVS